MATEKAPAFQFYPKDYMTDPRVRVMSFEQRGLYWDACCICWLEGSLPNNAGELAAILGCPPKKFCKIWPMVLRCFEIHGERLLHKRLDKERQAQAESRERRADAARKRWGKEQELDAMQMQSIVERQSIADAKQCSPSPSPSSSASSSPTPVKERAVGLVMNSLQFTRLQETYSFVGTKLRVPNALHSELMAKSGGNADQVLRAWYARLDNELELSEKGTGDVFAWLRPRHQAFAIEQGWIDAAPKVQPAKPIKRSFEQILADDNAAKAAKRAIQ